MKDKVVYLLGAGFSAPLGLPVMNNFLVRSKDMFIAQPQRYKSFERVFRRIADLSNIKNYFRADLFNIEEILSILEMGRRLEGSYLSRSFVEYISEVLAYYTPCITPMPDLPGNWHDFLGSMTGYRCGGQGSVARAVEQHTGKRWEICDLRAGAMEGLKKGDCCRNPANRQGRQCFACHSVDLPPVG